MNSMFGGFLDLLDFLIFNMEVKEAGESKEFTNIAIKREPKNIDTIMTSPGSSCTSYPIKVGSAQSQETVVDSENFSMIENQYSGKHKCERGSFKNTTNNIELKKESHLRNLELNGNDFCLERMSTTGLPSSCVGVQTVDKIQSCFKKSKVPLKKRVTFKTGDHSAEIRQVEHRYDTESLATKWPIRHPIIKKLGREMVLKLERIQLPMKGKCFSATSLDGKISSRLMCKYRKRKTESVLDTGNVRSSSKRYKTVGSISKNNVITEGRCAMKHKRGSRSKQNKSAPVIKRTKQFCLVYDCEVKLERLSPEFLKRTLSRQKKQQSVGTTSVKQVHLRCKTENSFYFQKSSGRNCGAKEETDGNLVIKEDDGSFGIQFFDDRWGIDRIDAWGNVRYLLAGHSILSESEEDWYGWWVRVDSLNSCHAHLHSISDGETESRILVWDNPFEAKPTLQNNTAHVPGQTESAKGEWAGWNSLHEEESLEDVSSVGFSGEESDEFHGW